MLEQNVLRLQVTVNDTQSKQCTEALQDRVGHLADEWRTQTTEMSALQQIIEIDTKQLKCDADVSSKYKLLQHVNNIELVISILSSTAQHDLNTDYHQIDIRKVFLDMQASVAGMMCK